MNQLVELGKKAEQFKSANTEVIAVFREEQKGEAGLEAIKEKTKTPFTLALDNGKKSTARYSGGKREFTGYVISPKGQIVKVIKGDLRNRATSTELLEAIAAFAPKAADKGSDTKGSGTKESKTSGSDAKGSATSDAKGSATKGSDSKGSAKK